MLLKPSGILKSRFDLDVTGRAGQWPSKVAAKQGYSSIPSILDRLHMGACQMLHILLDTSTMIHGSTMYWQAMPQSWPAACRPIYHRPCGMARHDSNTLSHGKTAMGEKQHFPPTKSPTFPMLWNTSKKIEFTQQQK